MGRLLRCDGFRRSPARRLLRSLPPVRRLRRRLVAQRSVGLSSSGYVALTLDLAGCEEVIALCPSLPHYSIRLVSVVALLSRSSCLVSRPSSPFLTCRLAPAAHARPICPAPVCPLCPRRVPSGAFFLLRSRRLRRRPPGAASLPKSSFMYYAFLYHSPRRPRVYTLRGGAPAPPLFPFLHRLLRLAPPVPRVRLRWICPTPLT